MAIDFSALKSKRGTNAAALQRSLEKTEKNNFDDPRVWKYTRDASKNISVNTIRLLPIPKVDLEAAQAGQFEAEDCTPMVKVQKYAFEGLKGWLHEGSLQTFGEDDPIGEWSRPQWKPLAENKEDPIIKAKRDYLKRFIPKTEYYANILVIDDAQKPENNGKVFLFKFGDGLRKFFDTADTPKFPTDPKFDAFCPWEGANIKFNLAFEEKQIGKNKVWSPDYKGVTWLPCAPLGTDEEIAAIWEKQYSVMEFLDRKNFKSYDDLKAKFMKVMNFDENLNPLPAGASLGKTAGQFLDSPPASTPAPTAPSTPAPNATPSADAAPAPVSASDTDDELASLQALLG